MSRDGLFGGGGVPLFFDFSYEPCGGPNATWASFGIDFEQFVVHFGIIFGPFLVFVHYLFD